MKIGIIETSSKYTTKPKNQRKKEGNNKMGKLLKLGVLQESLILKSEIIPSLGL